MNHEASLKQKLTELSATLLSAKSPKEFELLIHDLLTPGEIDDLFQRIQIVKALLAGQTQREISKSLGVSISKVTRGANALRNSRSGFKNLSK